MKRLLLFSMLISFAVNAQISKTARLDSIISIMFYNNQADTIQRIYYSYENSHLKNSYKDFSFDHKNNYGLRSILSQIFNSNQQLIEEIDSSEFGKIKHEYQYDQAGNALVENIWQWSDVNQVFYPLHKIEYTYNVKGELMLELYSEYDTATKIFIGDYRVEYLYTIGGDKRLKSEFYFVGNKWDLASKTVYTADGNHNLVEEVSFTHDLGDTTMLAYEKVNYQYNSSNQNIEKVKMQFDDVHKMWENQTKFEFAYDLNGNTTSIQEFYWNSITNQWQSYFKDEYLYDLEFTIEENAKSFVNVEFEKNNILIAHTSYDWESENSQWVVRQKVNYFYSGEGLSAHYAYEPNKVLVFPNPTSDLLKVESAVGHLELVDAQGEIVLKANLQFSNSVSLAHLASGTYIYRVITPEKVFTGKVFKL